MGRGAPGRGRCATRGRRWAWSGVRHPGGRVKIEFKRSGGFAGMGVRLVLESAALPAAERDALETLIARARFFELAPTAARPRPYRFQDVLCIQGARRRHAVSLHYPVKPEPVKVLLGALTARATG